MKNLNITTIVVLLVFFVTVFTGQGSGSSSKKLVINKTKAEGYVAFIVNEKVVDEDEDDSIQCDGSGWITHGDGHKTKCQGCESCANKEQITQSLEIDVKKKQQTLLPSFQTPPVVSQIASKSELGESSEYSEGKPRAKQILFFTASWCGPCQQWKRTELARFKTNPKWKISENPDAMIRIVDIDKPSNKRLMNEKKTRVVPEFVLLIGGKYDSHKTGYQSAQTVGRMYNN